MMGVTVGPVAGVSGEFWLNTFFGCHHITENGPMQWAWPDGGCFLNQELFLMESFQVIKNETLKIISEQRKSRVRR